MTDKAALAARIAVAINAATKQQRGRFAGKDWLVAEAAGRELAAAAAEIVAAGFEFTAKPMPVAPSKSEGTQP